MKVFPWLLAGVGIGLAVYVIANAPAPEYADGVDEAAGKLGGFGAKQRVTGTGGSILGKVKEGVGGLTGDKSMQGAGLADQAVGAVKDAVGQAAGSVAETIFKGNHQE